MKRITGIVVGIIMLCSGVASAGEKEELTLKAQMNQERMGRIEAQSIILQQQYNTAKADFEDSSAKLKAIEEKEKKAVKK